MNIKFTRRNVKNTKKKRIVVKRADIYKGKSRRRQARSLNTQKLNKLLFSARSMKSQQYLSKEEEAKISKENFAKTFSRSLVALDSYLQASRTFKDKNSVDNFIKDKKNQENLELKEVYEKMISRFLDVGEIEKSVFYYAWCLNRKAVQLLKEEDNTEYGMGENVLLFSSCLFLSIKMLIDVEKWFVEDFCYICGLKEDSISCMELCLVTEILEFEYFVGQEEIEEEMKFINRRERRFRILKDCKVNQSGSYLRKRNIV